MTLRLGRFAVLGLAIAATACSQPSQGARNASVARTAYPLPAALPTVDDRPAVSTRAGITTSTGTGTPADFVAIDMPLYPGMRPRDSFVIKHVGVHSVDMTVQCSVPQDVASVSRWYAGRLGSAYAFVPLHALGDTIVTFRRNVAAERRSVLLQREQNTTTDLPVTVVTLHVMKRR